MKRRMSLAGGGVALAAAALVAAPLAAPAIAATPDDLSGYRSVGYMMGDAPVTRNYQVADIIRTGAIDSLTHINYAFGNVTSDLVCDITNPDTSDEAYDPSNPDAGDAQNDYLRLVSAADSVDGVADSANQRLAGNFNQLRKLKAAHPDVKILISLGGWTWSDNFSEAVSTPESRTKLVNSCIDLYLEGNLPVYGAQGGAGAAAGIFDGIDVDWEWPVGGGETANAKPEDKQNFLAFMTEMRASLDAFGATHGGKHYLLTAFAPVGWTAGGGSDNTWRDPALFAAVDFLNVQGYDYVGGWTPTVAGHHANLVGDPAHNWGLGLAAELQAYINAGARPDQINAGIPIYGQGWTGVENGTEAWQAATGAHTPRPYYEIFDIGEGFIDEEAVAAWRWDEATGDWWSVDTPETVALKSAHVVENQLGGVMWWDLSGDATNCLVGTAGNVFRDGEAAELVECVRPAPAVDPEPAPAPGPGTQPAGKAELAATGSEVAAPAGIALVVLAFGVALVAAVTRRRTTAAKR